MHFKDTLQKYKSLCIIQSVLFPGPTIWAIVPQNIKNCKSLQESIGLIKVWKPKPCHFRTCKRRCKYCFHLIKLTPFIQPK